VASRRRIGVDFDGTLSTFSQSLGWMGPFVTGDPVPKMVEKVKKALAEGAYVGIFTARIVPHVGETFNVAAAITVIQDWCEKHIGVRLPVTHSKAGFNEMWDDRAVQVLPNTGETLKEAMLRLLDEEAVNTHIEGNSDAVWPLLALRAKLVAL
jgi:hypothetical protein